eukprot:891654-Prymnesium_polylepis.1
MPVHCAPPYGSIQRVTHTRPLVRGGLWTMMRHKAVLERSAAPRCLWHEIDRYVSLLGHARPLGA